MARGNKRNATNQLAKFPVDFPTGVLQDFAGNTAPDGWLQCDGSEVSRTEYAALFAVIGTIYGAGDGSTTFNLPDERGQFRRGLDDMGTAQGAAGVDVDGTARTVGQAQAHAFESHVHTVQAGNYASFNAGTISRGATGGVTLNQNSLATGGSETRPTNHAFHVIIKA